MNKTYLNYNSVEDVPLLNSRAAFQVDSSAVFREQGDIVPTIVDDCTSYMPWGGDNQMPFDILNLIESDETLSTCQSLMPKCVMAVDWCTNRKTARHNTKSRLRISSSITT